MKSSKTKIFYFSISIVLVLAFILLLANNVSKQQNINKENEKELTTGIAMMLETSEGSGEYVKTDDTSWADVIAKGYSFNAEKSTCKNGSTLTWNEESKTITFSGTSTDNCSVYFDLVPQLPTGSSFVTEKVGDTINLSDTDGTIYSGAIVDENGIRYEGKNPNNYVQFNDELWRIIGTFGENTHGRSGEQLIKLIRAESIGSYAWDSSNANNWNNASLKTILNTNYYYNGGVSGIKTDAARNMIQPIQWKIGGYNINQVTASVMYEKERGTAIPPLSSATAVTTETLPMGLMYLSDYGYAVQASDCVRTTSLGSYDSPATCHTKNWLFYSRNTWTITPISSDYNRAWIVYSQGLISGNSTSDTFATFPVLYLKQDVKITGGEGTKTNPYTLAY